MMVFLNSQLLSQVRKLLANSHWYFTFFPIKIPTRVIWWRLAYLLCASKQRNVGLNGNTWENILYLYQLRVSLRQTFLLCWSLSTTMTALTVSLRRARWHDGPAQREMLRESARTVGVTPMHHMFISASVPRKVHLMGFNGLQHRRSLYIWMPDKNAMQCGHFRWVIIVVMKQSS